MQFSKNNIFFFISGPNNKEFIEPKVQGLWRMAAAANFSVEELASLKVMFVVYVHVLCIGVVKPYKFQYGLKYLKTTGNMV